MNMSFLAFVKSAAVGLPGPCVLGQLPGDLRRGCLPVGVQGGSWTVLGWFPLVSSLARPRLAAGWWMGPLQGVPVGALRCPVW